MLLVYAHNVHILAESVHTIKKNTEVLVVASKEIGLKVTADKTEGKRQLILKRIFKKWGGGHGQLHLFTITEIVVTVLTIVMSKSNAGSSPSSL
jgi:hypothetical protein